MNHVISGLIEIENRAREIYESAAAKFADDPALQNFLIEMAGAEREHCEILDRAHRFAKAHPYLKPLVTIGNDARERLDHVLAELEAAMGAGPSKEAMMDAMVLMETLEWSEVFVYVMNALKSRSGEFVEAAKQIQGHKERVEAFMASRPEFSRYLAAIQKLPDVWKDSILVVDEGGTIADLIEALFPENGGVERARDGQSGIEKIKSAFFAAVICDMDMQAMDGLEFYRRASEIAPSLRERLLFFSDCAKKEHLDFFKEKNLRVLRKPAPVGEIKQLVAAQMKRA
jgi:CheY-like chemotaxis protein